MLTVGIDPNDCKKALDVARGHEGVFVSIGIHPQNADKYGVKEVQTLAGLCSDPCVVAIGETGFDLFRTPESEPRQKELFAAHIELARQLRLPLVIHDRQAHEQTLQVMNDTNAWPIGGVFHCFSGDAQLARTVTGKGFYHLHSRGGQLQERPRIKGCSGQDTAGVPAGGNGCTLSDAGTVSRQAERTALCCQGR